MRVSEVMTRNVEIMNPRQTIREAAQCMCDMDVGSLPIGDNDRLVGMVTDRDITVRGVAAGKMADTPVTEVMSQHVRWCYEDQDIDEVMDEMRDAQIRRLPVVDHDKKLVGIVSLGDLADRGSDDKRVGETLKDISTPSEPDRV
jgi:CBS domain-containing protein